MHGISRPQRWLAGLATAALLLIGAIVVWPEAPVRLLVAADGWQATGGFVAIAPPPNDLRNSVRSDPQARYWRSWSPERGSQPGTLTSAAFLPAGAFAVPYNGFAGEPGVNAYVECPQSGRRNYLATSRNNNQWSEVVVALPTTFCAGPVRIVAESTSSKDFIALGTPYALSTLSRIKSSPLAGLWFLLVAAAIVAGWFVLTSSLAARWLAGAGPATAGLIGIGLLGYLQFFVFWYLPSAGEILAIAIAVLGIWATATLLLGRTRYLGKHLDIAPVRTGVVTWIGFALAYFALATMVDSGAGPWEVNGRFTPARWSSDNQLPALAARILVSGRHQDVTDFSPWSMGDRPPLAYGWHATLHSLFSALCKLNDGPIYFYRYQLAIGVVLNSCWVAFLALALPKLGLSRTRSLFLILALSLFPFFIFNSVYIWPKMLSGTLTLAAAWILLGIEPHQSRLKADTAGLVAAAILSALGLLTHGGSAFGIIVVLCMTLLYRGMPTLRGALTAGVVALALLAPWSLWQSSNHVNGNPLVKFAFAGTFGFGEEQIGIGETIARSYHQLGWEGWIAKKRDGLMTVLFGLRNTCGLNEMGQADSTMERWRASDFYYIFPAMNFLALGLLGPVLWRWRSGAASAAGGRRAATRLIAFGLASIGFSWLTTWDCFINHHQAYQALIALYAGLALTLLLSGRWGIAVLACGMLYGLAVWVLEPLNHFARFNWTSIAALAATASLAVHALVIRRSPPEERPR